jgi:hypothetical protein
VGPPLVQDNSLVEPSRSPNEGYYLTEDLADRAIRMVLDQRQSTPDKPFFCYLATGAAHAPHQVPAQWIEPYRGLFDHGWEAERAATFDRQLAAGIVPEHTELTDRPRWVQDWQSLAADEQRLFARYMEVFAGLVTHADAQIGRFLDFLAARGVLDDTLVLVLSDNGASAEGSQVGTINEPHAWLGQVEGVAAALPHIDELGGHRSFNHYPWGSPRLAAANSVPRHRLVPPPPADCWSRFRGARRLCKRLRRWRPLCGHPAAVFVHHGSAEEAASAYANRGRKGEDHHDPRGAGSVVVADPDRNINDSEHENSRLDADMHRHDPQHRCPVLAKPDEIRESREHRYQTDGQPSYEHEGARMP